MKQYLYVLIADDKKYWAGITKGIEWWATYFMDAKVFINQALAQRELDKTKIKAQIHRVFINPEILKQWKTN